MAGKNRVSKKFSDLVSEDYDLTMFTIQSLTLVKEGRLVIMSIVLKRKVATELLTTYLPTILLLLITLVTIFFDKDLFSDVIAVNLTIMLVMTTIFTSKIEELPPTSDMKFIDIWLIFCLVVPFLEVILRTSIECANCSCQICEPTEASSGEVTHAWVGTGANVAPQQVENCFDRQQIIPCQVLRKAEAERAAAVETRKPKEAVARARCWKGSLLKGLKRTGEPLICFSCNCANPNVTFHAHGNMLQTQMLLFFFRVVCSAQHHLSCCGVLRRHGNYLLQAVSLISFGFCQFDVFPEK